jgi:anaerobic ribonucleoside-triphosphate reductase
MFRCERCSSGFGFVRTGAHEICPRCRARDGVSVPLTFAPFTPQLRKLSVAAKESSEESTRDGSPGEVRR